MQSCRKCGILKTCLTLWSEEEGFCRTCRYDQQADQSSKTPCGQQYCRTCGFLVERSWKLSDSDDGSFCVACTFSTLYQQDCGASTCSCKFCSNHYNIPPGVYINSDSLSAAPSVFTDTGVQERLSSSDEHGHITKNEDWHPDQQNSEFSDLCAEHQVDEKLREEWEREQLKLKRRCLAKDAPAVEEMMKVIKNGSEETFHIGGVDVSFIKGNLDACAALVVLSFPDLKIVYKRLEMIQLTLPYVPGYLALREVEPLKKLYSHLFDNAPHYKPSVIFVDGNGQLHPREFGLACHLGVELGVPCVGVAKTMMHVDGIADDETHKTKKLTHLKKAGDMFPLITSSGKMLGMAVRSTDSAPNPIYVSVGHHISLQSAVALVLKCCKYRIPEPTRHADQLSRKYLAEGRTDPEEFIAYS